MMCSYIAAPNNICKCSCQNLIEHRVDYNNKRNLILEGLQLINKIIKYVSFFYSDFASSQSLFSCKNYYPTDGQIDLALQ